MAKTTKIRLQEMYDFTFTQIRNQRLLHLLQTRNEGLSVFFAALCVIDLFGVFPIVALPSALITCGYYGIPLLMFVITMQIYTAVILGRCWIIAEKIHPRIIKQNRYPYAAVADLLYGRRMRIFVTILLDLTVFGAGVPNILVASQNLQLIGQRISDGSFNFSFCYWLLVLGVFMCPIMWLGSPKNMKILAGISVVTCSTVAISIWICILSDQSRMSSSFSGIKLVEKRRIQTLKIHASPNHLSETPDLKTLLKVYGMIAFQFDIHPMLMTIEVDMERKRKIGNAVCYGILTTCLLSVITTLLTAFKYGTSITPNVLDILPRSNLLYLVILLVTLQLCLSNAVGSSALYQHLEDVLSIPKNFNVKRCLLRSFIMALTVLFAELLPKFDLIMGIIGGTLTGPLIFILPPLFYRKITRLEQAFNDIEITKEFGTIMMGNEDGSLDDDKVIIMSTKYYGTFTKNENFFKKGKCFLARQWMNVKAVLFFIYSDSLLSILVIVFGLVATLASTYFNVFNVTSLKDFWSPCITVLDF